MAFKISSKTVKKHDNKYIPKDKGELVKFIVKICQESKDDIVDLNDIDLSNLTNISYLFTHNDIKKALEKRNIDVSEWDVSNIVDFHNTFDNLLNFDCDLSKWDMSNARDCRAMFSNCYSFTGKGLEYWDMSNVKDIAYMFDECEKFDCDLSKWNIKNIKDYDYYRLIFGGKCNLDFSKRPKIHNKPIA